MKKTCDFLKKCATYYLATAEGDQPRVRPFGTVNIFEGKLYFQAGKPKKVVDQLRKNPKIEICACMDGSWVRVEALAVEDDRVEARQSMLDAFPNLQGMYKADNESCAVYYLKNATATFYSFGGKPETEKF
jgi:uncharacterized pyridoxamine 5'-phosphate oxidase family protein